ncbi:hypothetical protein WKR88_17630 [Trinickia caryophylli]|uniref:Uncharacterized protein n=1 Tax=Trinickia caryophylli TaxID=28094 RepID=A0A1X7DY20_TRICW|nr:hypothetical protein [Trinickia caryophylli]PMS14184.1 hypothetical protein C0Z17_01220 [Trinickia caryophylli]TRX17883.1 hypothetical protein FNF07_06355 [Trinickia caryophylli]WQE11347.1 hypothetical protein U0034_16570 [Trinickia caryophylli]SMF23446.1 hypothetical protein SAMN06295900_104194 [Trinickia caryophylli]GLU32503.1 hypothetical protein Busp01_23450 [Trinickia caryophylli]
MNWLAEYFAQRAGPLTLSLWARPPLAIGPDGPAAQPAYALRYPGATLRLTPAAVVEHDGRRYLLPAHYDTAAALITDVEGPVPRAPAPSFFTRISIYAPSMFNPDFLVTVNDVFSFVPVFSDDGSPGFSGTAIDRSHEAAGRPQLALPWSFEGYISI